MPQNDTWKSSKIRFLHCKIFKTSETGTGMGPPIFWKKKYQKVVFTYIGRLWIGFYYISNAFLKWQLKSVKWKVFRNVCYPTKRTCIRCCTVPRKILISQKSFATQHSFATHSVQLRYEGLLWMMVVFDDDDRRKKIQNMIGLLKWLFLD